MSSFWQGIDWSRASLPPRTRTKVGEDLPPAVRTDDLGLLYKVPHNVHRTPLYDANTEHLKGTLPPGSPAGYAWMVWHGSRSDLTMGAGLDASGQWWQAPSPPLWSHWQRAEAVKESASAWMDQVQEFTTNVVLPTIAVVVGSAVGGVGGVLAAGAITAATKIARGGRVSDAVISTTRDKLPSIVASGVFDKTIDTAKTYGLDQMLAYGQKLKVSDERDAFAKAAVLATAMVSQEKSLAELKAKYPDSAAVIDLAASNQGSPLDIAQAIGGEEAKIAMDDALVRNAGGTPESGTTIGTVATVAGVGLGLGALAYFLL